MSDPRLRFRTTPRFLRWVRKNNLVAPVEALFEELEANPTAGDVIPGTGGLRKVRMAGSGRGKRGGFRVVYTVVIDATWLLLLVGYSKSDKDDLTADELNALVKVAARLEAEIRAKEAQADTTDAMQE